MYGAKPKYIEVAKAPISDKRNIVISNCSTGGYTIAQQSLIEEGDIKTWMFYRGAIKVKDLEHLYNVRDALNIAIKKIEEQIEEEKAWDDVLSKTDDEAS